MSDQSTKTTLTLDVCFGTSCFIRGAQELYTRLLEYVKARGIDGETEFKVSFCNEQCTRGPLLTVNGVAVDRCTFERAVEEIEKVF
jgi:NADH-quinone oxidoreductase subunit G